MKKQRQPKKRNKLFIIAFFLSISIYFIVEIVYGLIFNDPVFEIVKYEEINIEKNFTCIFLRDEVIVESPAEGSIIYFAEEGEKVPKGHKIAEIYTSNISEEDKEKLEELNERIAQIQNQEHSIFNLDINKINKEIDLLKDEIKRDIVNKNYSAIKDKEITLQNKMNKKNNIIGDKSFAGKNLSTITKEREELLNKINSSIIKIHSPKSGIISYQIDGLEGIINKSNILGIDFDKLDSIKANFSPLKTENVIYSQPIFKVVDNASWYIAIIAEPDDSKNFDINSLIKIKIGEDTVQGKVEETHDLDDKSVIMIKVNQHATDFHKKRIEKLDVILKEISGLRIHKDSIVEKDNILGVYVLDVNKRAVFKPIKVLGYRDEDVIIEEGYFYEDDKRINTVKLYDEVLRNGNLYDEGHILY